jgi:hypothetical protein
MKPQYAAVALFLIPATSSPLHAQVDKDELTEEARNTNDLRATVARVEAELRDPDNVWDLGRFGINLYHADDLLAITAFWVKEQRPTLELAWWKARHRDSRLLILALFRLKYGAGDISIAPDFRREINRFVASEAKDREEELKEVGARFAEIKPRLEVLIDKVRAQLDAHAATRPK